MVELLMDVKAAEAELNDPEVVARTKAADISAGAEKEVRSLDGLKI